VYFVEQNRKLLDLVDDGEASVVPFAEQRGPCGVVGEDVGLEQVDEPGGPVVVVLA
jgi:hypothetical protein